MSEPAPPPLVQVGDVIAQKYRVEKILGQGAMGMVVSAMHIELQERRAIKFMLPSQQDNPESSERFLREARTVAKLKSKHVATVYDMGSLPNGARYIVMEYLDGTDLKDLLKLRPILPVQEAVGYLLQACEAIGEAHQMGVVHRDLKPANMFLTAGVGGAPCIKVLDFGIAKVTASSGPEQQEMTATLALMGSPLYMSPEQIRSSRSVDPRADIWSIGVILYRMLTGQLPFQAQSAPDLFVKIFGDTPKSPSQLNPNISRELDAIVMRCFEKEASKRWQSAAELVEALRPHADPKVSQELDGTTHLWRGSSPPAIQFAGLPGNIPPPRSSSPGGTMSFPASSDNYMRPVAPSIATIQGIAPPPAAASSPHPGFAAGGAMQQPMQAPTQPTVRQPLPSSPLGPSSYTMPSPGATLQPVVQQAPLTSPTEPSHIGQTALLAPQPVSAEHKRAASSRVLAIGIAIGGFGVLLGVVMLIMAMRGNGNTDAKLQVSSALPEQFAVPMPPSTTAVVATPATPPQSTNSATATPPAPSANTTSTTKKGTSGQSTTSGTTQTKKKPPQGDGLFDGLGPRR